MYPQVLDQWLHQRHCAVCFRSGASVECELEECDKCHAAFHCKGPECASRFGEVHPARECESHAIAVAAFAMSVEHGTPLIACCASRENRPAPSTWNGYFAAKMGDFPVPHDMVEMPPVLAMLAEGLSLPLTILRALGSAYEESHLSSMARITVHVAGAGDAEVIGGRKFEEVRGAAPRRHRWAGRFDTPVEHSIG